MSFFFSFASGFLGFCLSFFIGLYFHIAIVDFIYDYWLYISTIIGFLTFLIGLILHQFVSMKYRNEDINKEVLETQIKALENELNPHFLFNALNSISELIYLDQKKAEKATLDLSHFLRNAINKEGLVSIRSEMDMVKTYLEIEKIRFENNIELKVSFKEEDELILVPKFSVQLLVENAIKHGYDLKKLVIDIKIDACKIKVCNNGKLTENITYGTGLSNLERRLQLLGLGSLKHKIQNNKMVFIIQLKEK
jgi:LytS/YehU family sensor histidine kinase